MSFAAEILAIAAATFTGDDGACTVRVGHDVVTALCTGIEEIRSPTDQGVISGYSGNGRYALEDELTVIKAGDKFEIKREGIDSKYLKARAVSRHSIGGAVRISMQAEFGE